MSFRINTNIQAMTAFRSLSNTGAEQSKSMTRLSTGLRINSGADDPAGLIAVQGYKAQIGGIAAALSNNQDAMNYAKTADGALDEVGRLLRDARSLAVANGNSSLDSNQKQANQTQLNNILTSIDRIATNTSFGTKKLLDGSAGTRGSVADDKNVQSVFVSGSLGGVQMTVNGTLDVNVTQTAAQGTVTGATSYTNGTTQAISAAGTFSINGTSFAATTNDTVQSVIDRINAATGSTGVTASFASNNIVLKTNDYGSTQKINVTEGSGAVILGANASSTAAGQDARATVTYKDTAAATVATATFSSGTGLTLKDTSGNSIKLTVNGSSATGNKASAVQIIAGSSTFQIGGNGGNTADLNLSSFSASSLGLGSLDITTSTSSALDKLDSAINSVSSSRGGIGSFMKNTLESNMRALGVAKENLSATASSLEDTDVAEEMTNYTKLNIIQQSGLAMLAQANSSPNSVLSLLRG